ncbi:MAG: succinate dehydrogenase cytochrome b subunit [Candidatus Omnitrophica bacterium]|nr:succinate dehydrogenase cytochrome b subunit [Candidatus Omnitrophota bacterium]
MCKEFLGSSVGRKAVVGVTGFILFGFVVVHTLGNLQIFLGRDPLNAYAYKLQSLPWLLWPARVFLLAVLLVHLWISLWLAVENRRARPTPYVFKDTVQATLASRTMVMTGLIILLFIVYHLLHFTFGATNPEFFHLTDAKGRHDVYAMVVLSYRNYWISGTYLLAMFFLCLHLSHGVSSIPQSLGWNDERWDPLFKWAGRAAALVIFMGNSSMPLAAVVGILK